MTLPPSVLQAMGKAFFSFAGNAEHEWDELQPQTRERIQGRIQASIQALEDAGYSVKKDPVTIQELQAEIGWHSHCMRVE